MTKQREGEEKGGSNLRSNASYVCVTRTKPRIRQKFLNSLHIKCRKPLKGGLEKINW